MRTNLASGFVCLFFFAGCTSQAPMAPEPAPLVETVEPEVPTAVDDPVPDVVEPPAPAESYTPLSVDQARAQLKERGIPYSQRSFLGAAGQGDLEVVRLFVEAGMNIRAQNPDEGNDTALMRAAGGGHLPVVKYLVSQDLESKTKYSHILLDNGRCAGLLAMEIEDPTRHTGCKPQTALVMAAWGGHVDVIRYLTGHRKYQAHFGWFDPHNGPDSAMELAAFAGHLEAVKLLRQRVHPNYKKYLSDFGAMAWASYQGHMPVVRYFFREGVRLNPGSQLDRSRGHAITQLMFAAWGGQAEVVRFLLDNGADMFIMQAQWFMDQEGNTWKELGDNALTLAIAYGHDEVVAILLNHWVYTHGLDGRDDVGRTTLMYAALWGNTEAMQSLVDGGVSVHAQTNMGSTALMFAASGGNVEAVRLLLDLGADPTVKNSRGHTVLGIAQAQGHAEIIELLQTATG